MQVPADRSSLRQAGFTLIEMMVTVAVAAILMSLAAPALQDFVAKSRITGLNYEFSGSVTRVRSEAIQRNTCVAMCASADTDAALPSCLKAASGATVDWQSGWILFVAPACKTVAGPAVNTDLILVHGPGNAQYNLNSTNAFILFDARGRTRLTDAGRFSISYRGDDNYLHNQSVCLNAMGRTRTVSYAAANTSCPN